MIGLSEFNLKVFIFLFQLNILMGELFIFVALFLVVFFEELKFGQVLVSEIGGGFGSLEVVDGVLDLLVLLVLVDD